MGRDKKFDSLIRFNVESELKAELERIGKLEQRDLSGLCRRALSIYVMEYDAEHPPHAKVKQKDDKQKAGKRNPPLTVAGKKPRKKTSKEAVGSKIQKEQIKRSKRVKN